MNNTLVLGCCMQWHLLFICNSSFTGWAVFYLTISLLFLCFQAIINDLPSLTFLHFCLHSHDVKHWIYILVITENSSEIVI